MSRKIVVGRNPFEKFHKSRWFGVFGQGLDSLGKNDFE